MCAEDGAGAERAVARSPRSELADLAAECGRLARVDPTALRVRLEKLGRKDQLELALLMPPKERLELLLHAPAPMQLARGFPDFETYLTLREIGPQDALPLLALASASQLLHLVDLEGWTRDRFDENRAGAWLVLMLEAGEPCTLRFLRHADEEVLTLLLARWANVEPIASDESPSIQGSGETESETDPGFVTPDGYHRFRPSIPEHGPAVRRIAEILFRNSPERYWRLLWATQAEVGAEIEEEALRWRQSRLEEHGFPGWEESLSIFASPASSPERLPAVAPAGREEIIAPRTALRFLADRGPLAEGLALLAGSEREDALLQVASAANHVLVAGGGDLGDPDSHRAAIETTGSYVGIALSTRQAFSPGEVAKALRRIPVKELFREGYAQAASLQQKALLLARRGWASRHPRALELLDSPILERVRGLLEPRPKFHDPSPATRGVDYRDFRSAGEIEEARIALETAEALGAIFVDSLGLDVESVLRHGTVRLAEPPRFSAVLLSALAWHKVRGEIRGAPLPAEIASAFLGGGGMREALDPFVSAVSGVARLDERLVEPLRAFGLACLARLHEECGALPEGAKPDPRYVSCLLLEGE